MRHRNVNAVCDDQERAEIPNNELGGQAEKSTVIASRYKSLWELWAVFTKVEHLHTLWSNNFTSREVSASVYQKACTKNIHSPGWCGGRPPAGQAVAGSIPGRVTCLDLGPSPSWGRARGGGQMFLLHINISLPLFLPPVSSL